MLLICCLNRVKYAEILRDTIRDKTREISQQFKRHL